VHKQFGCEGIGQSRCKVFDYAPRIREASMNGIDTPVDPGPYPLPEGFPTPSTELSQFAGRLSVFAERYARHLYVLAICVVLALLTGAAIVEGVRERLIEPTRATYLLLVVLAFTLSATFFVASLLDERRIYVESHWGGIGGSLGGWRVSRSLVFLLTTVATFALVGDALNEQVRPDLRERYRSAVNLAAQQRMRCEDRGIVDQKLVLRCAPPSDGTYDRFWDQIKLANSAADDIVIIRAAPAAATTPAAQASAQTSPAGQAPAPTSSAATGTTSAPPAARGN
jgi:hypothetical protein